MKKIALIFFLICSTAHASDVVVCQTSNDDNLQVVRYLKSVNTPNFSGDPKNIINPDLSVLNGVPTLYWKCSGGGVVEMTQPEKDAVDASIVTQGNNATKAVFTRKEWIAFIEILINEINTLRAEHGLAPRTKQQLKTAIENKIDE